MGNATDSKGIGASDRFIMSFSHYTPFPIPHSPFRLKFIHLLFQDVCGPVLVPGACLIFLFGSPGMQSTGAQGQKKNVAVFGLEAQFTITASPF